MKPELQRIAIAEACGYKWWVHDSPSSAHPGQRFLTLDGDWRIFILAHEATGDEPMVENQTDPIPDYLNDLNAMHEAENTIRVGKDRFNKALRTYRSHLATIIGCAHYQSAELICATAAQRAEAFLKTKGLWKL